MKIVKIGSSRQVVIPKPIHDQLELSPGDYLEVKLRNGEVVFTPQTLIDKQLAEGLSDLTHGRTHGPFTSSRQLISSLQRQSKKLAKKK